MNIKYSNAQQATPAVQSDADLEEAILKAVPYSYDPTFKDRQTVKALIAQHVQARTKPLVAALEEIASDNCGSTSPDLVDHLDRAQHIAEQALAQERSDGHRQPHPIECDDERRAKLRGEQR
jgi:hypothetical protein